MVHPSFVFILVYVRSGTVFEKKKKMLSPMTSHAAMFHGV